MVRPMMRLALGLALLGAAACDDKAAAPQWSDADREAVADVLGKAAGVRTLTLDLGDPKAAHFLKRHFEISNLTQDRYPGLHQLIADHSVLMAKNGVSSAKQTTLSDDLVYEDLATLMLGLYRSGSNQYTGHAVASMEAPGDDSRTLQISYTSLCFYDANNQPIGSCVTGTSFGSGQYFAVNNALNTGASTFTAAFSATYYDVTNKRYVAQLSTLKSDAIAAPSQQTISAPVIVNAANIPLATALVCTSRAVNANANPGVCDYGTYANNNVLVSMGGSVSYQSGQVPQTDVNGKLVGFTAVSLINTIQGGQCILSPSISGNNFYQQPQVTYSPANKVLAWNFNNLDFGSTGALLCGGNGTNIQFSLLASVNDTANNGNPIVAAQYSVAGTTTPHLVGIDAGALATPMLRVVAGCLTPDTRIATANGGEVPISRLLGEGELVRSAGGNRRVTGTVVGDETELYVITADNGLSVKTTAIHPFVTADGQFRAASQLKAGDRVATAKGVAAIAKIEKVAYRGKVHNLLLERPAHEAATPANESFYANGFLVGGHGAQQQIAQALRAHPVRVQALLPAQFRKDYQSHREDQAARR